MSPPRGASRTAMVDAMRDLLLAKGFDATTVDEVCERAEVTKGSFYHHFSSKDEMGMAALEAYFDDLVGALADGPFAAVEDPLERLFAFVDHVADVCDGPIVRQGCVLGVFALEVAERDPAMQAALSERFTRLADVVADLITDAAKAQDVTLDARALADHLLTIIEGGIVLAKAYGSPAIVPAQVRLFGDHLHLLFQRRDHP